MQLFGSKSGPVTADRAELFRELVSEHQSEIERLEEFLQADIQSFEPAIQDHVRYCFGHSGKKLRPLLVFLLGKASAAERSLIEAAAIVELVHLATLVHDDILDQASLRHRTETVVSRHGAHVAVLLGDTLFARALEIAAGFPSPEICRQVALTTRQVCSGEIEQTLQRGDLTLDRTAYFRIIRNKTAELFGLSAWLGATVSGSSATATQSAVDYALHLGMAYQIFDDLADIVANEAEAGKTLGTDLETGKVTLPMILFSEFEPSAAVADLQSAIRRGLEGRADLVQLLRGSDALSQSSEIFHSELFECRRAIADLGSHSARKLLLNLVEYLDVKWNQLVL